MDRTWLAVFVFQGKLTFFNIAVTESDLESPKHEHSF